MYIDLKFRACNIMISMMEKRRKHSKKKGKKRNPGARDVRRRQRRKDMAKKRARDVKKVLFDDHHFGADAAHRDEMEAQEKDYGKKSLKIDVNLSNTDSSNLSLDDHWKMKIAYKLESSVTRNMEEIQMIKNQPRNDQWYSQFMNRLEKTTDHDLFPNFPVIVNEILIEMVPSLGFLGFKGEICVHPVYDEDSVTPEPYDGASSEDGYGRANRPGFRLDEGPMIFPTEKGHEDDDEHFQYDALLKAGFTKMYDQIKGHLGSNNDLCYDDGYALAGKKLFCYKEGPYGEDDQTVIYYEILLRDNFVYLRIDHDFDGEDWCFIERNFKIYKLKIDTFLDSLAFFKGQVPPSEKIFALAHGPPHSPRDRENDLKFITWTKMIEKNWSPIVSIKIMISFDSGMTSIVH